MNTQLTNDLMEFLWRVRCGRKNDKVMRSDALVLALRVTQLQNDKPELEAKIIRTAQTYMPERAIQILFPPKRRLARVEKEKPAPA